MARTTRNKLNSQSNKSWGTSNRKCLDRRNVLQRLFE